jgi:hypothetical protein
LAEAVNHYGVVGRRHGRLLGKENKDHVVDAFGNSSGVMADRRHRSRGSVDSLVAGGSTGSVPNQPSNRTADSLTPFKFAEKETGPKNSFGPFFFTETLTSASLQRLIAGAAQVATSRVQSSTLQTAIVHRARKPVSDNRTQNQYAE